MRILICLVALLQATTAVGQSDTLHRTLYFPTAGSMLSPAQQTVLKQLLPREEGLNYQFTITGHTDDIGTEADNRALSRARADAVHAYLLNQGVPSARIRSSFAGELEPKVPNSDAASRGRNRRVDIILVTYPEPVYAAPGSAAVDSNELVAERAARQWQELRSLLETTDETFCVQPFQDTVIVTKDGAILYLRANSFASPAGPIRGCIDLTVRSRTKPSELIIDDLTTVSGNDILVSQHMLFVEARNNGRLLRMNTDMTVFVPTDTILPDAKLFRGTRDEDGHMTWGNPLGPALGFSGDSLNHLFGMPPGNLGATNCPLFFCRIFRAVTSVFRRRNAGEKQLVEEWKAAQQAFLDEFGGMETTRLADVPEEKLQYYVFNRRLGWSNIDWMFKVPDQVTYRVEEPATTGLSMRVLFKARRSMVALEPAGDAHYRLVMPNGHKAWLIALKLGGEQPALALEEVRISDVPFTGLSFQSYTIPELAKALKKLD